MTEIFGSTVFFDQKDVFKLIARLVLDMTAAFIIIGFIYHRLYRNHEYVFTYFMFNVITFLLCFLLRKVPIELGFALGLFAVFGILRYRTEAIRIRDLTYLFIVIGLGILNALANKKISVTELLLVNGLIVGMTALLELPASSRSEGRQSIYYDKLELLRPGSERELYKDLSQRIGLEVVRVEVVRIDMLRDAAELTAIYVQQTG